MDAVNRAKRTISERRLLLTFKRNIPVGVSPASSKGRRMPKTGEHRPGSKKGKNSLEQDDVHQLAEQ